jgi:hypothetical protein
LCILSLFLVSVFLFFCSFSFSPRCVSFYFFLVCFMFCFLFDFPILFVLTFAIFPIKIRKQ